VVPRYRDVRTPLKVIFQGTLAGDCGQLSILERTDHYVLIFGVLMRPGAGGRLTEARLGYERSNDRHGDIRL